MEIRFGALDLEHTLKNMNINPWDQLSEEVREEVGFDRYKVASLLVLNPKEVVSDRIELKTISRYDFVLLLLAQSPLQRWQIVEKLWNGLVNLDHAMLPVAFRSLGKPLLVSVVEESEGKTLHIS